MDIFREAADLKEKNIPFALATIISAKGSTPRTSAKMIIIDSNTIRGTIGGGLAESYVIQEALKCLKSGQSKIVTYTLDNGTGTTSIAMNCGGEMEIFIEVISARPDLIIIGGGHVGLSLAQLAEKVRFNITIVENRKEFATVDRFSMASKIFTDESIETAIAQVPIDKNSYIVIATGGVDEKALRCVINSEAAYIGLLSSKRKSAVIINNLLTEGIDEKKLAAVYAPVGLDFKAETPEEIAFSILAEIIKVQKGAHAKHLKKRLDNLVIVRGGGDIASGTIARLFNSGYRIVVLEVEQPTVIRSKVSFAQAMFDGSITIDGITAIKVSTINEIQNVLADGMIPVVADPQGSLIKALHPSVVVDGILAKKNLGTTKDMAPVVIGLGPGFEAGYDVDAVIETNRGHNLGRVILQGKPEPNTGVPGVIGGHAAKRVVRSTAAGRVEPVKKIGDLVQEGDLLATIGTSEVRAQIPGVLRGMIHTGMEVPEGFKIGDVDARGNVANCFTISDKARAVGGGTLEALLYLTGLKRK